MNTIKTDSIPVVSVVLPCLNEEAALETCLKKIQTTLSRHNVSFEIVVCDNGSDDNSPAIARRMGVKLVEETRRGYGYAYLKGFSAASGQYMVMGDADDTYDFNLIPAILEELRNGFDFVTGSRYEDGGPGNLPFLSRVLGNPALTAMVNFLFGSKYTDVYCGLRGFSRTAFDKIRPSAKGMEFNLELAIKAHLAGLKIKQIPIRLAPRLGQSKLSVVRDGWRSLVFILSTFIRRRIFKAHD